MATVNKDFRIKTGLVVETGNITTPIADGIVKATSGVLGSTGYGTSGQFLQYNGTWATPTGTYTLPTASTTVLGGVKVDGTTITINGSGVISGSTTYTLPTASATVLGGIKIGTNLSIDGSGVVSSTDTNYYPTAFAWTGGTTAGPTGSLTVSGASAVSYAAIPSAAVGASGIVTTGAQEFGGTKTLTSPSITTSLTTTSTTFALVNTTATTVNFAGAATALSIGASTGTTTVNNSLTVTGDLVVNGTTTTINSTTITVDDKNIELGSVASPTNTTADGAGLTVLGTGNKTWSWVNATSSWTSNQDIDIVSTGTAYRIAGTSVLNATTLGSGVVNSSLTKIGALSAGTAGFVKVDASGNLTSDGNTYLTSSTGVTTVNGASGAITNVAKTTDKLSVFAATTSAELAGVISDETGTGALVFANTPTLVTPVLGVATATSINGTSIPSSKTLVVTTDKLSVHAATSSAELAGVISDETGSGSLVFGTAPTLASQTATGTYGATPNAAIKIDSNAGMISGSESGSTLFTISNLFDKTVYTGGEFTVKLSDGTDFEIIRLLVVIKGTTFYVTQYGDVQSNASLATIDFTLSTNNVNITVTPAAGTVTAKVVGTLLAA